MKTFFSSLLFLILPLQIYANVATHQIQQVAAYHQGDAATGSGSVTNLINRSGLTIGNPNDISTWIHNSQWENNWQGQGFNNSAEDPVGWLVLDLGSSITYLQEMYLWNVKEVPSRGLKDFKVYYSDQPGTLPSFTPNSSVVDYLFETGWNQLGDIHTLAAGNANGGPFDGVLDLSEIESARYIGIEFLSNHNADIGRVGLAEIVITVPEPTKAWLMISSAMAFLGFRRRNA